MIVFLGAVALVGPLVCTELWSPRELSGPVAIQVWRTVVSPLARLRGLRHDRRVARALPGALDAIVVDVRSGRTLIEALRNAADRDDEVASELRTVIARVNLGIAAAVSLREWATSTSSRAVALVATGLALLADLGGPAAEAIMVLAERLRDELAAAGEVQVHTAQARVSALVVGALPLVVLMTMSLLEPGVIARSASAPIGRSALVVGLVLNGIAVGWMRRITRMVG